MSTPKPPPLGDLFNDRRRPTVYADQVDKGKVLVTGPPNTEHPSGFSGTGIREGRKWLVEDEYGNHVGNARNATHVGHVLAKHHGHAPDSYDVEFQKEQY